MIGSGALAHERERSERLLHRMKEIKNESKQVVQTAMASALTVGGAFVGGYVDARWPEKNVMGVPPSLAAGAALAVTGLFGVGGEEAYLLLAAGNGLASAAAAKEGATRGTKDAQAAPKAA